MLALATLGLLLSSAFAAPTVIEPRVTDADCRAAAHGEGFYQGTFSAASLALLNKCTTDVQNAGFSNNIYSLPSCVAAATSNGLWELTNQLACFSRTTDFNATSLPHLDFNIYASIVGDCAWNQPEACPITQQNYIDFIFGEIGKTSANPSWPTADVVIGWWNILLQWTATGQTTPYSNFDDFLHFSESSTRT